MTCADRRIQEEVEQFQRPGVPVRISRLIGIDPEAIDMSPADRTRGEAA